MFKVKSTTKLHICFSKLTLRSEIQDNIKNSKNRGYRQDSPLQMHIMLHYIKSLLEIPI